MDVVRRLGQDADARCFLGSGIQLEECVQIMGLPCGFRV